MTTTVDRTTQEQQTTRPPGFEPDGHRGPGEWLSVAIAVSIILIALIAVAVWWLPVQEPIDANELMGERWAARAEAEWRAEVGEAAYVQALQDRAFINRVTDLAVTAERNQLTNDLMAQRWIARAQAAWEAQSGNG